MPTETSHQDVLRFIVQLQAAIRTVRLYPPSNPLVQSSITALQNSLDSLLQNRDAFVLAESENHLIIDGTPLGEKEHKKDQVLALRGLLQHLGLQSIGFTKGLPAEELRKVVELLSVDTKTLQDQPFSEIAAQMQLAHMQFNQKVYVAVDPDRQLLQSLNVKDAEIVNFFKEDGQSEAPSVEKIRQMAADPQWIGKVFVSGLKRIASQTGPAPNADFSKGFSDLLKNMDQVIDRRDWQKVTTHLAHEVAQADMDTIFSVAVQDVEKHLGEPFLNMLANQLDPHQFKQLVDKLERTARKRDSDDAHGVAPATVSLQAVVQALKRSAKGQQFEEKKLHTPADKKQARRQCMESAAEAVKKMRRGDYSSLGDRSTLENLPQLVKALLDGARHEPAGQLVDTIAHGMLKAPPQVHADLLQVLEKISDGSGIQRHPETMISVCEHLCAWFKTQHNYTPESETVCKRIGKLAREFICAESFTQAVLPLATLREIAADRTQRDDALCQACRKQIDTLTSTDIQTLLVEKMRSNESKTRTEVSRILTSIGPACVEQLLDILLNSASARERLHIISVISGMGPAVAPAVIRRIRQRGPWYYLRNLVRLLGDIGSETHLDVLVSLLDHDDFRVRWEVLGSIFKIGGQRRGTIFLEQLPIVEDRLKLQVVSLLGGLRYRAAVPVLIKLLEKRSLRNSHKKIPLQKKICTALGQIGSSLAIPVLSEISEGRRKSVFKSYHPAVKAAAAEALNTLQQSLETGAG